MKTDHNLNEIFRLYGQEFESTHPLFLEQRKALRAIATCRTAQLGGHVDRCPSCGHEKISYNSCRNHNCPTCQGIARRKWIESRLKEVLPVPYYHLVFTIPEEINRYLGHNQKAIYGLLFQASSATILHFFRRHYGGLPGILATLHTWGQTLSLHPHIHMLVTGGCLSTKGDQWTSAGDRFLFDVHLLSEAFRKRFLRGLVQLAAVNKLYFSSQTIRDDFHAMIQRIATKPWVVHCKSPFAGAKTVIEYLGRYVFRSAISNSRIKKVDHGRVSFAYKDYRDSDSNGMARQKVMNLNAMEFIRRFLQHIPPKQFCRIRFYGFLAGRNRKANIAICHKLLGCVESAVAITESTASQFDQSACPVCGGKMVRSEVRSDIRSFRAIHFHSEETRYAA